MEKISIQLDQAQLNFILKLLELQLSDEQIQNRMSYLFKGYLPSSDAFVMFNSQVNELISYLESISNQA